MSFDSSLVKEVNFKEVRFRDGYAIAEVDSLLSRAAEILAFFEKAKARGVTPVLDNIPGRGDDLRSALESMGTVQFQPAYDVEEVTSYVLQVADFIDSQFAEARRVIEEAAAAEQERRVAAALERKQREEAEARAAQEAAALAAPVEEAAAESVSWTDASATSSDVVFSPSVPSAPEGVGQGASSEDSLFDDASSKEAADSLFGDEEEGVMEHLNFGDEGLAEDSTGNDYRVDGSLGIDFMSEEIDDPEAWERLHADREHRALLNLKNQLDELDEEGLQEILHHLAPAFAQQQDSEFGSDEDDSLFGGGEVDVDVSEEAVVVEPVATYAPEPVDSDPVDTTDEGITLVEFLASVQYLASHRAREGVYPVVVKRGNDRLGVVRVSTDTDNHCVVIHLAE